MGDATRGGEWAAVRLVVDGDRITSADAHGLERSLENLTLLEAAAVSGEPLVVEALAAALGQVFLRSPEVRTRGRCDERRGGQRCHAAARGSERRRRHAPSVAGPDTARPPSVRAAPRRRSAQARAACHALGVPHVTLDLREEFREAVVDPFVAGYAAGDTPNPCARCNGVFRFDALLAFARRAGAETLWTGHYARVVERDGGLLVARARDTTKDQSYMLSTLDPGVLERVRFPLGEQTKDETRAEAARAGLAAATRAESQEACFLAGDDYRRFLERHGLPRVDGEIVDERGAVVGRHDGYWAFTPGQRRGLRLAAGRPLYVLRTDRASNAVVVGDREALAVTRIHAEGHLYVPPERAHAKLRYRSAAGAFEGHGRKRRLHARPRRSGARRCDGPDRGSLRR